MAPSSEVSNFNINSTLLATFSRDPEIRGEDEVEDCGVRSTSSLRITTPITVSSNHSGKR